MPAKGLQIIMLKRDGLIRTIARDGSTGSNGDPENKEWSGEKKRRADQTTRQAYTYYHRLV